MLLTRLGIRHFRSLEDVTFEGLSSLNVFVGRNNAGKSSVQVLLQKFASVVRGESVDWTGVITQPDAAARRLQLDLTFTLSPAERERLLQGLSGDQERIKALIETPLFRTARYVFESPSGNPELLHLRRVTLPAEDGKDADVVRMAAPSEERGGNPTTYVTQLHGLSGFGRPFASEVLECSGKIVSRHEVRFQVGLVLALNGNQLGGDSAPERRILVSLVEFFERTFFFAPYRHSVATAGVQAADVLATDGSNLPQVLHSLLANDQRRYRRVQELIDGAVPDLGALQTPLFSGNQTEVAFRPPSDVLLRLRDMGAGLEQLLMVAAVLVTRGPAITLFVDEPESHLHPGAQRYLLARLVEGSSQVFLSTHSPVFLAPIHNPITYRFQLSGGTTSVTRADQPEVMAGLLGDLGVRNSDLLLSDALVFVEGEGDEEAFIAIDELLGSQLQLRNINVVAIGGSRHAIATARVTREVLRRISAAAPVPHMFVLDRDERSNEDVTRLREEFGERIRFLTVRELENHMLVPRAILAVLTQKAEQSAELKSKLDAAAEAAIQQALQNAIETQYVLVLLKRVAQAIAETHIRVFDSDDANDLSQTDPAAVDKRIAELVAPRLAKGPSIDSILAIVHRERAALDVEWSNPSARSSLAPGSEVLDSVFRQYGLRYRKPRDTIRLARALTAEELSAELRELVALAAALAPATTTG